MLTRLGAGAGATAVAVPAAGAGVVAAAAPAFSSVGLAVSEVFIADANCTKSSTLVLIISLNI